MPAFFLFRREVGMQPTALGGAAAAVIERQRELYIVAVFVCPSARQALCEIAISYRPTPASAARYD